MDWPLILQIATAAAFVLVLFKLNAHRPSPPSFEDNHTIPAKSALAIATALIEGRPAIFHGGCNGCIFRHQNTTHTGIAFCRGCLYFAWQRTLPDKSINEYDLEKL